MNYQDWGRYRIIEKTVKGKNTEGGMQEYRDLETQKSFKIEVLGNGISCILRPSQCVNMSFFFFNLGSSTKTPSLDPRQQEISKLKVYLLKGNKLYDVMRRLIC